MTGSALAGATEAAIATFRRHSLRRVRTILDAHYLDRDPKLGEPAVGKLERRTKRPTALFMARKKKQKV